MMELVMSSFRARRIAAVWLLFGVIAVSPVSGVQQPQGTIVLRTSRLLDGRGAVLVSRDLVIRGGMIVEIVPGGSGVGDLVYDLTSLTVLPGYIDTHVHISRHFDPSGKLHPPDDLSEPGHLTLYGAENAYNTLMSGVTTIQSLGGPEDADLKEWIARGTIPGPRLLTSLGYVTENTGSPEEIRRFVRDNAAAGADVIKIFASTSIRFGGVTNLSLVEPPTLELIAESGMYLGTQIDLLFRNYAENAERYAGIASYTMDGFANLQEARPGALRTFQESLRLPGLKLVYSTDAVAGGHGRNAQELVAYAEIGGKSPMDVIISATSLAAESLGLDDRIGSIAPGLEADIIALDGDPLSDAAALDRVVFVMRAGKVYKNEPAVSRPEN